MLAPDCSGDMPKRGRDGVAKPAAAAARSGAFDPKLLLNPKAALLRRETSSPEKDANAVTSSIERLYGVKQRTSTADTSKPKKRQGSPDKAAQARTSGIVGKELQEASKQAEIDARANGTYRAEPTQIRRPAAIEISDDDGDDDLVLVGAATKSEQRVCFGMLRANVNAFAVPQASSVLPTQWPVTPCELKRGNGSMIHVHSRGERFGVISIEVAAPLGRLIDLKLVDITARLPTRPRKPGEEVGQTGKSLVLPLEVLLYGDALHLEKVGIILSQRNCFLVTPTNYDNSLAYTNPHQKHSYKPAGGLVQHGTSVFRTAEEVNNEIQGLFNKLRDSLSLPEHDTPPALKTQLLKHQRQGLTFCLQHERGPLSDSDKDGAGGTSTEDEEHQVWRRILQNGRVLWRNVITPQVLQKRPRLMRGGILADEMGLGKTLTMIALLCETMPQAAEFAASTPAGGRRRCKSTLIVSPLSVLSNWAGQVAEHTRGGLSVLVNHGKTRVFDADEIAKYDVVLTTYALVANEHKRWKRGEGRYVLPDLDFYRIVLDEAHQIKDITTQQSQAAAQVGALNRWAVTASPVHNSLNDLAALFAFLHLDPFDNRAVWAQYINGPMKSGQPVALNRLQTLLKMSCLRRTKDLRDADGAPIMELPTRTEELRLLQLADSEKRIYDDHLQQYQRRMRVHEADDGTGDKVTTLNVLQCINRLRQICLHPAILADLDKPAGSAGGADEGDGKGKGKGKNAAPKRRKQQTLTASIMEDDDLGDWAIGQACAQCGVSIDPYEDQQEAIEIDDSDSDDVPSDIDGETGQPISRASAGLRKTGRAKQSAASMAMCAPACMHFYCAQHAVQLSKRVPSNGATRCVARGCDAPLQLRAIPLAAASISTSAARVRQMPAQSTKLTALLLDLTTLRRVDADVKSVIFSQYTSFLSLLSAALSTLPAREGGPMAHARLEGGMSREERQLNLDRLASDAECRCILVSTRAGGVGLNLTMCSRVFVCEPSWNPSIEAQAMDRVHRIGQTRDVLATRYVVEGSIEQTMLALQKQKRDLASLSLSGSLSTGGNELAKKLLSLKSLLR